MKRGFITNLIVYSIVGIVLLTAGALAFRLLTPEPPQPAVEEARMAISRARDHQSEIYSSRLYREARNNYDSAMAAWQKENRRFILLRNYEKVTTFAGVAQSSALDAMRSTITRSENLRSSLENTLLRLNAEMAVFEKIFLSMPLTPDMKQKHARGKLLLREAEIDFRNGKYVDGTVKVTEADEYISGTYNEARKRLTDYFKHYPEWMAWASETIEESRQNSSYVIVVEKIPPACHLYYRGERKYSFEAELGSNWLGDKMRKGDMATPEGRYHITRKLSGGLTRYYKALLINYPNRDDIREFNERVRSGHLPVDATIGGLIEIHGDGGKGGHWTEGCVALKNSDMDILFKHALKGTAVTLIGSTMTYNEFITFMQNGSETANR